MVSLSIKIGDKNSSYMNYFLEMLENKVMFCFFWVFRLSAINPQSLAVIIQKLNKAEHAVQSKAAGKG